MAYRVEGWELVQQGVGPGTERMWGGVVGFVTAFLDYPREWEGGWEGSGVGGEVSLG